MRPLELNWKNVGELCNYNHNLSSGLHHCNAKARQGGEDNKVKGQQKGAVFNISQQSEADTGKVQETKQYLLLYDTVWMLRELHPLQRQPLVIK